MMFSIFHSTHCIWIVDTVANFYVLNINNFWQCLLLFPILFWYSPLPALRKKHEAIFWRLIMLVPSSLDQVITAKFIEDP